MKTKPRLFVLHSVIKYFITNGNHAWNEPRSFERYTFLRGWAVLCPVRVPKLYEIRRDAPTGKKSYNRMCPLKADNV